MAARVSPLWAPMRRRGAGQSGAGAIAEHSAGLTTAASSQRRPDAVGSTPRATGRRRHGDESAAAALSAAARARLDELIRTLDPLGSRLRERRLARRRDRARVRGGHAPGTAAASEEAATRQRGLSADARPLRSSAHRARRAGKHRRPPLPAGLVLRRLYRGRLYEVTVVERGFELNHQRFRSLSAVARAITHAHWNGRLFFGLIRQHRNQTHAQTRTPE